MYYRIYFFIFFVTILNFASLDEPVENTLPVRARVQLLKDAINQDILNRKYKDKRAMFAKITPIDNFDFEQDYEYEDETRLTPVMDNDERKFSGKNAMRLTKPKKTKRLKKVTPPMRAKENSKGHQKSFSSVFANKKNKNKRSKIGSPNLRFKDIFYRRYLSDIPSKDLQYLHCIDLITPIIRGHKRNITVPKRIPKDSLEVMRLLQLLTEATVEHTKHDIRSIIYQISNLQIRLYQWDSSSLKLLLHAITRDPSNVYSFKTIKYGLKKLFETWQLDLSNTTSLLKQAKIFRPPCVHMTPNSGSTKSPSSPSFKVETPPKAKIPCLEYSRESDREDCEANR